MMISQLERLEALVWLLAQDLAAVSDVAQSWENEGRWCEK
jgi:hypothetical protein